MYFGALCGKLNKGEHALYGNVTIEIIGKMLANVRLTGIRNSLIIALFFLFQLSATGQSVLEWSSTYKLTLDDFRSSESEIGGSIYSVYSTASIDFAFQMSQYEFMFTKNLNDKVTCSVKRNNAYIIAPDDTTANQFLQFAQYEFDLAELYARKIRQKLFENKGAFSSANFFQPVFNEMDQERSQRNARAAKETDIGRKADQLAILHEQVLTEIAALEEFCKSCKPSRKKKKE